MLIDKLCTRFLGRCFRLVPAPYHANVLLTIAGSDAFRKLKHTNPQAAEYLLSFASIDEKKCAPVQAADALVYEVRRALNTRHKIPGLADATYREQFKALISGQAVAHIAEARKEQLEWIAANHKPGEPFKLDELMNNQIGDNIDLFGIRQI